MRKNLKKKNEKTEDLHVRLAVKEKKKISKEAENLGVSISEYIRLLIMGKKGKGDFSSRAITAIVLCQDFANYMQEKYGCEDDEEIERRLERLWNIL